MTQLKVPMYTTTSLSTSHTPFTIGDKNRLKSNSGFTHFKTNGDSNIKTLFEEYKNCTLEATHNPPSPLELPATIQINSVELDLTTEAIIQDTIEVWPHKGRIPKDPYLKSGMYFFPHLHVPRYLFLINPYASLHYYYLAFLFIHVVH